MSRNNFLLFFVLESVHYMLLQHNKCCDFSRCPYTTVNSYEQPGGKYDLIKYVKSKQGQFLNDIIVSRELFFCLLFIKNVYYDTHSTIQAGE